MDGVRPAVISRPCCLGALALSPREWQTLSLLASGLEDREIATAFGVSTRCVYQYTNGVYQALQLTDIPHGPKRVRATLWYQQHRHLHPVDVVE